MVVNLTPLFKQTLLKDLTAPNLVHVGADVDLISDNPNKNKEKYFLYIHDISLIFLYVWDFSENIIYAPA